jgi:hypothetical protein
MMEPHPQVTAAAEADDAARAWRRPLVVVPAFVVIAAIAGFFPSFSVSANVLILLVGGVLFWLGVSGRAGRRPAPTRLGRGAAWWLVPVLLLAMVELFAFTKHSTGAYPTLSLLADPVLEQYLARSACYFAWLAAFWGLIRR